MVVNGDSPCHGDVVADFYGIARNDCCVDADIRPISDLNITVARFKSNIRVDQTMITDPQVDADYWRREKID